MFTALIPVAAFAVNIVSQVLGYRLSASRSLLKSIFAGFGAGLVAFAALSAYGFASLNQTPFEFLSASAMGLVTYSALGYGYFHFLNLGTTARRIRLLIELSESPEGLSYEEILGRYNAAEMVERRLGRMLSSGQVVLRDGRYFIGKPVLLLMARAMTALKHFVLGKQIEFD